MITLERTKEPYAFDGPYSACFAHPLTAADKRHIFIINDILKCWPFKSALEIGSFYGATATAFVEAINSGQGLGESGIATFCDVAVSDSLMDVVQNCKDMDRVRITPQPSWAVLDSREDFDFIFVDGAHDMDSVTIEVTKLLRRRPLCVMAHDTNATDAGYSKCEGAKMLREQFAHPFVTMHGYRSIEDREHRKGERTDRGLFLSTSNNELFQLAQTIFQKWKTYEIPIQNTLAPVPTG